MLAIGKAIMLYTDKQTIHSILVCLLEDPVVDQQLLLLQALYHWRYADSVIDEKAVIERRLG